MKRNMIAPMKRNMIARFIFSRIPRTVSVNWMMPK